MNYGYPPNNNRYPPNNMPKPFQQGIKLPTSKVVKPIPTIVKIIAIIYYISAVLSFILGLLFIAGAGIISSIANQIPILGAFGTGLFVIGGIIIIGLSVLSFLIGRGLQKAQSWARIVAIIISVFGVLIAILSMIQGNILSNILGLAIYLIIAGYLLFNNSVKEAFA